MPQYQVVVLWRKKGEYLLVETIEAPSREAATQTFKNQLFCLSNEELFTTYVVPVLPRDSIPLIVDEEVPLRPSVKKVENSS